MLKIWDQYIFCCYRNLSDKIEGKIEKLDIVKTIRENYT